MKKTVVEINLGINLNEFDKDSSHIILKKAIKTIESDNIKIYTTNAIKNRIEIAKSILEN